MFQTPESAGFPPEQAVITVSQLNRQVARLLDSGLPRLWVSGEISNFTQAASGHWYFSIKDDAASVRAVMFRSRAQAVGLIPRQGDRFEFHARVSLYEPRGDYQLQVDTMRRAGAGDLHAAFLRLRDQLTREGLIDPARRRRWPAVPHTVAVISSLSAAALQDVLTVMARRAPHVRVIVYPSQVQGREAPGQLVQALQTAATRAEADVLLLVRGGGSLEDLWCFNDETLARTIAASPIPVISGVGHETDFTIADFVADLRAPTPTAAAELCCRSHDELMHQLQVVQQQMHRSWQRLFEQSALRLDRAAAQLVSPARYLQAERKRLQWARQQLVDLMARRLQSKDDRLQTVVGLLAALDPRAVLQRGYAIVHGSNGAVIKNALDLTIAERLDIEFGQGIAQAEVTQIGRPLTQDDPN